MSQASSRRHPAISAVDLKRADRSTRAGVVALYALALFVLALMPSMPAHGQPATIAARVELLGLETITADGLVLYHSADAKEEALDLAETVAAAIAWYRSTLGWNGAITMAMLDESDYLLVTPLPYPSPHTESATEFIVVADHVESHPGFDLWDLDGRVVNSAWTLHEIGHVIAHDLGIGSANHWIDELVANVIMAGYIRAERPDLIGYQSGMPPRFADANHFSTLAEFDELYFAMGQLDYLWFHFHLAGIADFIVSGPGGLAAAIDGFRREFPAEAERGEEPIADTILRLERISPGVSELTRPLVDG
jgi:hypothetical protein